MKEVLYTTHEEFTALHYQLDTRKSKIGVNPDTLIHLLMDHSRMFKALQGKFVEPQPKRERVKAR